MSSSSYNYLRPVQGETHKQVNVRIPERFKGALELIASLEGCSVAELATEGIGRVLEDRAQEIYELTADSEASFVREKRKPLLDVIENMHADK